MSLKANKFATTITNPMNIYNFQINIPGVTEEIALCVQSTSFPSRGKTRNVDLYVQGEKVTYPTLPENGGTWSFKIPDSDSGIVRQTLKALFDEQYNEKEGTFHPHIWKDIDVFALDQPGNTCHHVILHGAWIQSLDNVNLDASNPGTAWQDNYTFVYNYVENVEVGVAPGAIYPFGQ